MLQHYIKVAIRNLRRQKMLAAINILGLSIGLACFILFLLYALNEFSFDKFHANAKDIYRVYRWEHALNGQEAEGDTYLPMPVAPALKQDFADVEKFVRFKEAWRESFIKTENDIARMSVVFADPDVFNVFSFNLIAGDLSDPLNGLNNIVLTEETASQLFDKQNPVGKTIQIKVEENFQPFTVSAIVEDPPVNSSIQFKILGNFKFYESTKEGQAAKDNWKRSAFQTYVQLKPGSTLPENPSMMMAFWRKYYSEREKEIRKKGEWSEAGSPVTYGFQPITSIHTDTIVWGGFVLPVDPKNIWILLAIAAGVLVIACINFTTLAMGRSAGRAKEVGIRKVVGSQKKDLLLQFYLEAFLLTILSTVLGILLVQLLLPFFSQLSGRDLEFSLAKFPQMLWLIGGLVLIVSILAGSYPSLMLSKFKPVEVLKNKLKLGGSNFLTKSLVTVQFVLSVGLIISTLVITEQLKFMRSKHPGFNKENVLVVNASGTDTKKLYPLFKKAALDLPVVAGVTSTDIGLGEGNGWSLTDFEYEGKVKSMYEYFVDNDYLDVMKIELLAGRDFNSRFASDTVSSVIVNEALVKDFGWTTNEAIGKKLSGYSDEDIPVIIGVVKDFNYRPLNVKIHPQMFHRFSSYKPTKFLVRIKPGDPSAAIASLQTAWKQVAPEYPLKYSFLDEDINRFYKAEDKWSTIIGWAGGISIFLASLGLFGLAALAAVNRTKEIGIRKILGASLSNIIAVMTRGFLKLIVLAFLIASPLAWYFMSNWLEDFAYRIDISWWMFALAGLIGLAIAFLTISFQALKAASANPVKNLRTE